MTPIRLVIVAGCLIALLGAGYMSFYGVAATTSGLTAAASIRAGSPTGGGTGGGYGSFGRIK